MKDGAKTQLRNLWYLALPGRHLKSGRLVAKKILGEPLVVGRTDDGQVFALRDICPHRGVPLSYGNFDGREVACCFHGWRFGADGRCSQIPSMVPGQKIELDKIRVASYPCREHQGLVWVFIPSDRRRSAVELETAGLPPVPEAAGLGERSPQVTVSLTFPCHSDHANFGLVDPGHVNYVHVSRWWKQKERKPRDKEKRFEPVPLGWSMVRHKLPSENRAYRVLGKDVSTEILFTLPGLRYELIEGERHSVVSMTAVTPVDETTSEVHHSLYGTMGWLAPLKPLIYHMAKTFLSQDREMARRQSEGLAYDPTMMLIDDANTQFKWHARLKREWMESQAEGRPFENPLKPTTLRWRS